MGTTELVERINSLPEEKRKGIEALVEVIASPPPDPWIARIRERRERLRAQYGNFGTVETIRELREYGR